MNIDVVESVWMEPATTSKKKVKQSAYLKRRMLGEKGVGRFATARLAKELELVTREYGNKQEVYAYFDWTQFDNDELYLDQVLILAEEHGPIEFVSGRKIPLLDYPKSDLLPRDGSHGTILKMSKLKRTWGARELADLQRGLSRLASPFDEDRGFKIFLQFPGQSIESAHEIEPPQVIKYPHYILTGSVISDGRYDVYVEIVSAKRIDKFSGQLARPSGPGFDLVEVHSQSEGLTYEALECGPFDFRVLVWDRDELESVDQKIGTGIRSIRKDLDSIAGISIYRDGFRVLPYGEPENDWLKLDLIDQAHKYS